MDYEKKYKEAVNKIKNLLDDGEKNGFTIVTYKTDLESIFPELKESEDELTWLKKYIEEEAYSLSMDIRGNEDRIKLKNLQKALAWLEKQGECHISHDDEIMIKQLTEYFTTGHGLQNTNKTVVEWLNDVKEKLEKQAEVESDNDDIEAEEEGIRKAFNKIEDEKQCKQKPFDYKNQGTQNSHKFNIGDIISNGNVEFRIDNIVKNCVGQDCYFLVDVESEKNGTRYLTMCVRGKKTSHMGETTWLCEQVDKSFKKQGEQKPADIVEPKFNVGDWILYSGDHYEGVRHITKIDENGYYIERNGLPHGIIPFNHEICMRLWTIQNAKDGDVLAAHECLVLFKKLDGLNIKCYCTYHYMGFNPSFYVDTLQNKDAFHPATKEQRNLLFQKMKEAGYEWDADKKELKKISQRMISAEAKEAMYAKTAWSEEDEKIFNKIIRKLDESDNVNHYDYTDFEMWLIDLKERLINI